MALQYDDEATISWVKPRDGGDPYDLPLEEHFGDLTLREAVIFAMDHLNSGCLKSVIIKCGSAKYNWIDIETIYGRSDFPRL
jgi:hypothetical protein